MDIIEKLLRTADAYQAEARAIRAANRGGEASSAEVDITVSITGAVERVVLSAAFTSLSAASMTEKFWTTYRAAVRDAEAATIAATPVELHDPEAAAIQAEEAAARMSRPAEDSVPGAQPLPRPNEPTPWTDEDAPDDLTAVRTGAVDWPAGVPDGSPAEVMAAMKREIAQIVERAEAVGPEIQRLRGHGAHPEHRPLVRAEVVATGVPTSITFTPQAQGADEVELAASVLAALTAAKDEVADHAQALWRQAGMTGDVQDAYPLHPGVDHPTSEER